MKINGNKANYIQIWKYMISPHKCTRRFFFFFSFRTRCDWNKKIGGKYYSLFSVANQYIKTWIYSIFFIFISHRLHWMRHEKFYSIWFNLNTMITNIIIRFEIVTMFYPSHVIVRILFFMSDEKKHPVLQWYVSSSLFFFPIYLLWYTCIQVV